MYLRSHLCYIVILFLQQFLDFPECLVPLPQNSQRAEPNLESPSVGIMFIDIYFLRKQIEAEDRVDVSNVQLL